jgi:hypothetical protein
MKRIFTIDAGAVFSLQRRNQLSTMHKRIWAALLAVPLVATLMMLVQPVAAYADGGPYANGNVAYAQNTNGTWEKFWVAPDCHVYHAWGARSKYGSYTGSASMAGCARENLGLDVGKNADGRLEVFVVGTDNALWHNYQTRPSRGPWSGWHTLGGSLTSGPKVLSEISNYATISVFAFYRSTEYEKFQTRPNCCWSPWVVWQP